MEKLSVTYNQGLKSTNHIFIETESQFKIFYLDFILNVNNFFEFIEELFFFH